MSSAVNREIRKPNILHPCTPFNTDRNIALDRHIFFMRVKTLGCEKSGREIKHPEIACASRLLLSSPLAQQRLLSKPSLHLCVHTSVSIHIHMPFSGKPISSGVCTWMDTLVYPSIYTCHLVENPSHLVCVHTSVSIHIHMPFSGKPISSGVCTHKCIHSYTYAVQLKTHLIWCVYTQVYPFIYICCSVENPSGVCTHKCIHPYICCSVEHPSGVTHECIYPSIYIYMMFSCSTDVQLKTHLHPSIYISVCVCV